MRREDKRRGEEKERDRERENIKEGAIIGLKRKVNLKKGLETYKTGSN